MGYKYLRFFYVAPCNQKCIYTHLSRKSWNNANLIDFSLNELEKVLEGAKFKKPLQKCRGFFGF
ncbi:hypothetical protein GCM10022260_04930 [Gaetbulibacter aestuarii]